MYGNKMHAKERLGSTVDLCAYLYSAYNVKLWAAESDIIALQQ